MSAESPLGLRTPLLLELINLGALWAVANAGYYALLPVLGYSVDYNQSPIAIAVYFLLGAAVSVIYFGSLFREWLVVDSRIWRYGALSIALGAALFALVHALPYLPLRPWIDTGPASVFSASPWYFLPKAADILMQQVLIVTLVLALHYHLRSYGKVLLYYGVIFGGAHILLFLLIPAFVGYSVPLIVAAFLSTFIFPYLILKVRGGFVYSYAVHLLFYIVFALIVQAWPSF